MLAIDGIFRRYASGSPPPSINRIPQPTLMVLIGVGCNSLMNCIVLEGVRVMVLNATFNNISVIFDVKNEYIICIQIQFYILILYPAMSCILYKSAFEAFCIFKYIHKIYILHDSQTREDTPICIK